jgi:chemotaxis protein MotB
MYRYKKRHESQEHEELDRWLVSYADYMTLMFALFVVLYAMAIIKEEEYTVLSQTLGTVFERSQGQSQADDGEGVPGEGLLTNNDPVDTEFNLYGTSLMDEKGPELLDDQVQLSEVTEEKAGSPLESMEEDLKDALFDLIENGYADVKLNDDWLTIEFNSGLLFVAGSAAPTTSARLVMKEVNAIIGPVNNYIRVRGYTDDRPIATEIYSSNWELSIARAMVALKILATLDVDPARMAVEGYGQYAPFSDNETRQGRADNRKVVIALSKYALQTVVTAPPPQSKQEAPKKDRKVNNFDQIQVIKLPSGGLRITTRNDNPATPQQRSGKDNNN